MTLHNQVNLNYSIWIWIIFLGPNLRTIILLFPNPNCLFSFLFPFVHFSKLRNQTQESFRSSALEGTTTTSRALQTEVFGLKKSGSRRFNWAKLRWKPTDQDECAICLEQFKVGETLVNLPCAHRFHTKCLTPWLETNSQCPCCRMGIWIDFFFLL